MKTPARGKITFEVSEFSEQVKRMLLRESSPCYLSIPLKKSVQVAGHEFSFAVLPIKMTPENQLQQIGRDVVLCQTQAEANESGELLTAAAKQDVGTIQVGNLGGVAFSTNLRCIITEYATVKKTLPGGRRVWMAIERKIDKATGEVTVKRKQETANEPEAHRTAQQWQGEYNAEKKKYFDAVAKSKVLPPAPLRCEPLTETDRGDTTKAQMQVLRRQWKHCFELFDKRKAGCHFSEDDCLKAYLLDLAEQGENPLSSKQPAGTDKEFWQALMKAGTRAVRGNKKLLLQLVDYLIAFNWGLGWCYLSEKELAERISGIAKTTFTPGQIGKRRERLGLVAKHLPGSPFKLSA
jgi:hypothetical protein